MKRCVVAADDFAFNAAVDEGIVALIEAGVVTAASCLATSPRWPLAARRLDAALRAKADVGVHVDLTEFEPLASRHAWLAASCYTRSIDTRRVRATLNAQLQRFEDALGAAPDYIDGHRHVHQLPVIREQLIELLADRYAQRLPWVRISRARADAGWKGRLITSLGSAGLAAACRAAGVATNAHLFGLYDFAGDAASYRLRLSAWLAGAADRDVLMCHPASRIDGADRIARARVTEFQVLSSPWWKTCLESHEVSLSRGIECFTP
ncbi:MAG: ChbG/HpnK family deacetylase [Burkholderiaceae bacterium]